MNRPWGETAACGHCRTSMRAGFGECPRCGRMLAQSRSPLPVVFPFPTWFGRPLGSWFCGRDPRDLALYLACVPLLIGLPAAALVIFALRFVRTPTAALVRQWSTVIIVAILNILVSAYALAWLSELFWAYSLDGVRSFWDLFLPWRAMP